MIHEMGPKSLTMLAHRHIEHPRAHAVISWGTKASVVWVLFFVFKGFLGGTESVERDVIGTLGATVIQHVHRPGKKGKQNMENVIITS